MDLTRYECVAVHGVGMLVYRAGDKHNLLVMTGYCVQGTLGHAVVMGKRDAVPTGDGQTIDVKCAVRNISFRCGVRPEEYRSIDARVWPPSCIFAVKRAGYHAADRLISSPAFLLQCAC